MSTSKITIEAPLITRSPTFRLYNIRCYTCSEPIGHLADDYENLIRDGTSCEETLNHLGLTMYCCRISMKNFVTINFDVENKDLVEGKLCVEALDIRSRGIGTSSVGMKKEGKGITLGSFSRKSAKASVIGSIEPNPDRDEKEDVVIPINLPTKEWIQNNLPTVPGIPTINPSPEFPNTKVGVGAAFQATLLSGRTYLAR